MNKWILCLMSFLPFYAVVAASPSDNELQMINEDIQLLKDKLHKNRIKEMKEEVEGQGLMIADWDAYAKDLEQIRKLEEQDKQIKQHIEKLEERKAYLIQQQSHS